MVRDACAVDLLLYRRTCRFTRARWRVERDLLSAVVAGDQRVSRVVERIEDLERSDRADRLAQPRRWRR